MNPSTSLASLLPRATAFRQRFFAYGEPALPPLPALSAEGGFTRRHIIERTTLLVPLASLDLPNQGRRVAFGFPGASS